MVERALEQEAFADLIRESSPLGTEAMALLAHPEEHIRAIAEAMPRHELLTISDDTTLSPGSWQAAMRGLGGACYAVDEVMTRKASNAFCASRPPGHHAEYDKPMGFCLFNTAAVAARHAQKAYGAERVAILDWDVHHGNGTQNIFWDDASVLYASIHEMPLFPGTGDAGETGAHDTIVNTPLRAGDGSDDFNDALKQVILPRIEAFQPDLIIISAGFDAHWRDPLGNINLSEADFNRATRLTMDLADHYCGGRVVSLLEGGYDLVGLSRSVAAHVTALMHG